MASLSFFSASAIRSLSPLTSANSNFARLTQMVLLDIFQVPLARAQFCAALCAANRSLVFLAGKPGPTPGLNDSIQWESLFSEPLTIDNPVSLRT